MSKWRRTVPAMLIFILASAPFLYFQVGNLVYTQAAPAARTVRVILPETHPTSSALSCGMKTSPLSPIRRTKPWLQTSNCCGLNSGTT